LEKAEKENVKKLRGAKWEMGVEKYRVRSKEWGRELCGGRRR
jgi:hypothetical protein